MKKIILPLKIFPEGIFRLILVIWIASPFITYLLLLNKFTTYYYNPETNALLWKEVDDKIYLSCLLAIPAYYALALIAGWIYKAFKTEQ